jgi:hypothetical protein
MQNGLRKQPILQLGPLNLGFSRFFGFGGMRPAVQLGKHGRHAVPPFRSPLLTHVSKFVASKPAYQADGKGNGQKRQNVLELTVRTFAAVAIDALFHFYHSC